MVRTSKIDGKEDYKLELTSLVNYHRNYLVPIPLTATNSYQQTTPFGKHDVYWQSAVHPVVLTIKLRQDYQRAEYEAIDIAKP